MPNPDPAGSHNAPTRRRRCRSPRPGPSKRLHAQCRVLGRGGLPVDEGVATVLAALEKSGSGLAAQITVDALFIDKKLPGNVLGFLLRSVGHGVCATMGKPAPECQEAQGNATALRRVFTKALNRGAQRQQSTAVGCSSRRQEAVS